MGFGVGGKEAIRHTEPNKLKKMLEKCFCGFSNLQIFAEKGNNPHYFSYQAKEWRKKPLYLRFSSTDEMEM